MLLPPVPDLVDLSQERVLIADDVADTGATLELVRDFCAERVGETRVAVLYEKSRSDDRERLRLAAHRRLDHVPLERRSARRRRHVRIVSSGSAQRAQPGGVDPEPGPGEVVQRAVGPHARERAVDLGDRDRAALASRPRRSPRRRRRAR